MPTSRYGGTLVVGISGFPDTLDPTLSRTLQANEVYKSFCEQLYDYDARSRIVPQLAAALPIDLEGQADLHDPAPAGDPVQRRHAVQRPGGRHHAPARSSRSRARPAPASSPRSTSVTASGPSTVVIHLNDAVHAADGHARPPGRSRVVADATRPGSATTSRPTRSASGPFMFDHQVVGDNVTVIKSPYYYDQAAVHLDKIVFKATARRRSRNRGTPGRATSRCSTRSRRPTLPAVQQSTGLRLLHANGLGWRGHHHQPRQQERCRQPALHEPRHAPRSRAPCCGRHSRRRSTETR